MERLYAAEQAIRHHANDVYDPHFMVRPTAWGIVTSALDALGDSCEALIVYEQLGLGDHPGEQYLRLYGLLQGVFLQQESIRALCRVFLGHDIKPAAASNWGQIREIRNMSVAHPIEFTGAGSPDVRHMAISRITLTDDGFDLYGWNASKQDHVWINVNLPGAYEGYKQDALKYLLRVRGAQRERWAADATPDGPPYPMEEIEERGC